ncbi:MAG: alpha/beta hydrolase family protein [Pirellulaceae bacterium]|nr:alpha/beta hydrolase family protein [Pirellulaceae bacterium]
MITRRILCLIVLISPILSLVAAAAESPRVLPTGKVPQDRRLEPLKDLNGYFPFTPSASPGAWNRRAERVRRQLLVSLGLWPLPTRTPLNPVIHGRVDRDDYTVDRVYFESMPGFYVTGSLYRPKNHAGPMPAVLCPHGHWANGRFYDTGLSKVKQEIKQGGEQFEEGGRSPLQSRCVQLARMGCVVFHYDMIGYADSTQISFEVAHRFAKQRLDMNRDSDWGLFSPQAESHGQSVMGLQSWNSIRALDFVSQLPNVDPQRLAVTGASGGGTQTFILCAIDPRPAVAFPAVMVSTAMQGGCTCENASGLRVDTGNVEFAALFAPKPLALSAADDWTKEMSTKGFPELREHYAMLGHADRLMLLSRTEFAHNYNSVTRHAMYHWLNEHLKLGVSEPISERDYQRLSQDEMTVWSGGTTKPAGGPDFERELLAWWHADTQRQLQALTPSDASSLRGFREIAGGAIDVIIGRDLPAAADVDYDQNYKEDRGDYLHMMGLLRNESRNVELPISFLYPTRWEGQVVIWLSEEGKAGLLGESGIPIPPVSRLLSNGAAVVGVDLLSQGEFLADGKQIERTDRVKNPREAAAYTFGYNHTVFAKRVHDVLTVIAFAQNHETTPKRVDLVGLGPGPAAWAAAARAQARDAVGKAAIASNGFRFGSVKEIHDPNFLPAGARYFDLPGMLAVAAPETLWLGGEGNEAPEIVRAAYKAAGSSDQMTMFKGKTDQADAAVSWLLAK